METTAKKARIISATFGDIKVIGRNPREFDQFFTSPGIAIDCITCLEQKYPLASFGNGAFVQALLDKGVIPPNLKFIDIDSSDERYRADFLNSSVVEFKHSGSLKKPACLTVGNPPFGKNSSLAILFFNKAAEFSRKHPSSSLCVSNLGSLQVFR